MTVTILYYRGAWRELITTVRSESPFCDVSLPKISLVCWWESKWDWREILKLTNAMILPEESNGEVKSRAIVVGVRVGQQQ